MFLTFFKYNTYKDEHNKRI